MNQIIGAHTANIAQERSQRTLETIALANWQRAQDAYSYSEAIGHALNPLSWLNSAKAGAKSFSEGHAFDDATALFHGGHSGINEQGVQRISVENSFQTIDNFLVVPFNQKIEKSLKAAGIEYAIDSDFMGLGRGEETIVLEGDTANLIEQTRQELLSRETANDSQYQR